MIATTHRGVRVAAALIAAVAALAISGLFAESSYGRLVETNSPAVICGGGGECA